MEQLLSLEKHQDSDGALETNQDSVDNLLFHFQNSQADSDTDSEAESGASQNDCPKQRSQNCPLHECFIKQADNSWRCDLPSVSVRQGRTHSTCSTFQPKNGCRHLKNWHP